MDFCSKKFVCAQETIESFKRYSSMLEIFITTYSWLSDAFVLDFFTEEHWEKLPKSWKEYLSDVNLEHLSEIMSNKPCSSLKTVLPLSLQAFSKASLVLAWPRKTVTQDQLAAILAELTKDLSSPHGGMSTKTFKDWKTGCNELSSAGGQHESLGHVFRRRVKPKKQHEIFRCAEVISRICSACQCTHVVDIGSGQGHLSRYLGFQQGLNVISVEGNGCHISGAQKLDSYFNSSDLCKKVSQLQRLSLPDGSSSGPDWEPPKHVNLFISPELLSSDFLRVLHEPEKRLSTLPHQPRFTFLGLHTCGNLAPTMLRLYSETQDICALVSVGCCYMKLNYVGFPMSKLVSKLSCKNLSYEAKEVSCHALEHYSARILVPTLDLKWGHATFVQNTHKYVSKALCKQSISIPNEDCHSDYINVCLSQWKRVVIFYSLRLMVAPLIESLILLDRMFYLYENGCPSCLVPVFEPSISPRNHVLVSVKLK